MNINKALDFLNKFIITNARYFPYLEIEVSEKYNVRKSWGRKIPFADDNGVYLYVLPDDEIVLIGKSEYERGGGIGRLAASHLGDYDPDDTAKFKNHKWKNEPRLPDDLKQQIAEGNFHLYTIKVEPDFYCSLLEVTLQTFCLGADGNLPPLNKRIG